MVAEGCTVYTPIFAHMYLGRRLVLGGVKDKYLFKEISGDQYARRCISFLDQLKNKFAVYLPYFDGKELSEIEKIMFEKVECMRYENQNNGHTLRY